MSRARHQEQMAGIHHQGQNNNDVAFAPKSYLQDNICLNIVRVYLLPDINIYKTNYQYNGY